MKRFKRTPKRVKESSDEVKSESDSSADCSSSPEWKTKKPMAKGKVRLTHCRHCGKAFKTKAYAVIHQKSCVQAASSEDTADDVIYRCECCGGSYSNKISYNAHLSYCSGQQANRGRQPHRCEHCDTTFVRLHDLKRHVEIKHAGIKRLTCHLCYKPFGRTSHLRRHLDVVHRAGRITSTRPGRKRDVDAAAADDAGTTTKPEKKRERKKNADKEVHHGKDVKKEQQQEPLLCPFIECGLKLANVQHLREHLAEHCNSDSAAGCDSAVSIDEANYSIVELSPIVVPPAAQTVVDKPKASNKRIRSPRRPLKDPFMCPLNKICCSTFNRIAHVLRHLETTHRHVFAAGLAGQCTTLGSKLECLANAEDAPDYAASSGRKSTLSSSQFAVLRRSAMMSMEVD